MCFKEKEKKEEKKEKETKLLYKKIFQKKEKFCLTFF